MDLYPPDEREDDLPGSSGLDDDGSKSRCSYESVLPRTGLGL